MYTADMRITQVVSPTGKAEPLWAVQKIQNTGWLVGEKDCDSLVAAITYCKRVLDSEIIVMQTGGSRSLGYNQWFIARK